MATAEPPFLGTKSGVEGVQRATRQLMFLSQPARAASLSDLQKHVLIRAQIRRTQPFT